jgi:hypothetical protein
MKTRMLALMLMAGGTVFAQTHFSIGVQVGRPAVVAPAPFAADAYRPPRPGPGYVWIEGYYDEFGNWYDGYWELPPYVGAYWVAPRFYSGHFYAGYWRGSRGIIHPAPRFAAPRFDRGHGRGFDRPGPDRNDHGFRDRGNGPARGFDNRGNGPGGGFGNRSNTADRGRGRGGESRSGFRR